MFYEDVNRILCIQCNFIFLVGIYRIPTPLSFTVGALNFVHMSGCASKSKLGPKKLCI